MFLLRTLHFRITWTGSWTVWSLGLGTRRAPWRRNSFFTALSTPWTAASYRWPKGVGGRVTRTRSLLTQLYNFWNLRPWCRNSCANYTINGFISRDWVDRKGNYIYVNKYLSVYYSSPLNLAIINSLIHYYTRILTLATQLILYTLIKAFDIQLLWCILSHERSLS